MRFYIPELGDKICLISPWTFDLWPESRNVDFVRSYTKKYYNSVDWSNSEWGIQDDNCKWHNKKKLIEVTLPFDTILSISRIYVRKGAKDFSSVSFYHIKGHGRFWAKLEDVNKIDFEKA
jgi:hypothetical protein